MGFRFNGVLPEICTATALQQSEIVQQPFVIKAADRGVNILDHVLVKAFRVGLQCLKEMKGLGAVFNFYCGQTEIKRQIMLRLVRFGSFFFHIISCGSKVTLESCIISHFCSREQPSVY